MVLSEFFNDKIHEKQIENAFANLPLYFFRLVRFKDLSHKNPKYRWHLTFRIKEDLWCFITSFQTSTNLFFSQYYDDEVAGMSVVQIRENEYKLPFSEVTYLDCNIKLSNKRDFNKLKLDIDWSKGIEIFDYIPPEFSKRVAQAIVQSPLTSDEIKKGFKKVRPELFSKKSGINTYNKR